MTQNILLNKDSQRVGLLSIIAVVACYIFAYFTVWQSLVGAWSASDDYSHAFLILPISIYLTWNKREKLSQLPVTTSWLGFWVVLFSAGLFLLSFSAGIKTLSSFALILSLVGAVIGLFGLKIAKELLFPLFFLFLMIPIPTQLYYAMTTPLQLIVSKISVLLISFLDVPIYREGNVLHLPDRTLQVVAACSGMRTMISLTTLSLVYGYISLKKVTSRSLLVILVLPVAVFINIIRVMAMVLVFYFFKYDLTEGSPHTYLGLVVFVLAIALMIMIQTFLSRLEG